MKKYYCSGFQSIKQTDEISMREAAGIFANRAARRKYGCGAFCRTILQTAYSENGSLGEYSAFIGYTTGQNETTGQNINFTVRAA